MLSCLTAIRLGGVLDLEGGNPISAAQVFDGVLRRQPDNRRVQVLLARAMLGPKPNLDLAPFAVERFG